MKYSKLLALCIIILLPMLVLSQEISKVDRAKNIVAAVNQKDAKLYIENFTKDVKIYMYSEDGAFDLKVDGIEALYKNRAAHLKKHPDVRNEIQHLAEIDNRLVMHDRVWLTPKHTTGSDIVEIFTFDESGKISRVDVLQQSNLFSQEQ
ncbi:nuclear transport factor 2 family protein [uncultured Aquimarina sp.]|uniref:nuclear transport factor 2 family protein n=1 Tax=uncultured Aquimarina sp. TaxID=575652 RepID=UPI002604D141|nr:nuclear transport factor 2 family protein [uncultured Aquimarina sp.]